jgi:hypothetical protein
MWIAKKPFKDYKKGDEVKKEDAMHYGSIYCTQSGIAPDKEPDNNDTASTPAPENPVTADGSAVSGDEGAQAQQVNAGDPVNLEDMDYKDLKELAASKGLEFKHNISKVDLIALIESKTE